MADNDKQEILDLIREALNNNRITFPKNMSIKKEKQKLIITLPEGAINSNMQDNIAAFEGWAFAIHTHYAKDNYQIELDLTQKDYSKIPTDNDYLGRGRNGHINRFLYRVLRFIEQYEWFSVADKLKSIVEQYERYLNDNGKTFVNNSPDSKEAKDSINKLSESFIENLIEKKIFKDPQWKKHVVCDDVIYRQLPVGLFLGEVSDDKRFFTGGKSAIDLWSCKNDDIINIFELKYDNRMIGIITEIFFYCNYVRDMYSKNGMSNFKCNEGNDERGYSKLKKKSFTEIKGYMLYDEDNLHPIITKSLIDEMNKGRFPVNSPSIKYERIAYKVNNIKCDISIL